MWCFFIDAYVCLLYLFVSILSAVFYIALSLRSTQYTCKYNLAHFSWKGSCGTSSYWNCPNWITDSQPEYQLRWMEIPTFQLCFISVFHNPYWDATENRRLPLQQSWTLNRKLIRKAMGNSKGICKSPWKISKFPRIFSANFSTFFYCCIRIFIIFLCLYQF